MRPRRVTTTVTKRGQGSISGGNGRPGKSLRKSEGPSTGSTFLRKTRRVGDEPHQHGVIAICDIVGFSEKKEEEQVACVRFLDRALEKIRRGAQLGERLKRLYVNCTGDGFLAALPFSGREDARSACLKMAQEIVKASHNYKSPLDGQASLRVRFGLHRGDYIESVKVFGRNHTIGNGPNRASRVANVGDASQIVVSSEFLDKYESAPEAFIGPYTVPIKHNDEADVFLYRGFAMVENGNDQRLLPRRLFLLRRVDSTIDREITAMLAAVEDALEIPKDVLRLRISVFLPDRRGCLYCAYRRKSGDDKPRRGGETVYKLSPPQGVLGVAFTTRKIIVETGLPPKDRIGEYIEWWLSASRYNLTREHIEDWSRRPQALIGIPFGTGPDPRHDLHGVLCVDTRHPLTEVEESRIVGTAEALKQMADERLAWKILAARSV